MFIACIYLFPRRVDILHRIIRTVGVRRKRRILLKQRIPAYKHRRCHVPRLIVVHPRLFIQLFCIKTVFRKHRRTKTIVIFIRNLPKRRIKETLLYTCILVSNIARATQMVRVVVVNAIGGRL